MAYRLANVGGFELILSLEDRARAGRLCQYVLKPAAHAIAGLKAAAGGAFASLAARPARPDPASCAQTAVAALSPETQSLQDRVRAIEWYHTIDLGNGAALKLTTAVYLTPNGTDINKKGITPDIVVKDDTKTKVDEQLQAALRYIARQEK
jgi:hypothetical protein